MWTVLFGWVPQYVCDFPSYVCMVHRLESTEMLVMELHDFMAHHFGRTQVTQEVYAAFENRKFSNYSDGEHSIYIRHS